jgi:hypothetical protein
MEQLVYPRAGAQVAALVEAVYRRGGAHVGITGVDGRAVGEEGNRLCRPAVVLEPRGIELRIRVAQGTIRRGEAARQAVVEVVPAVGDRAVAISALCEVGDNRVRERCRAWGVAGVTASDGVVDRPALGGAVDVGVPWWFASRGLARPTTTSQLATGRAAWSRSTEKPAANTLPTLRGKIAKPVV